MGKKNSLKPELEQDQQKFIVVRHGLRKELMEHFGTTYPTVKSALKCEAQSELANEIRAYALSHGGVMVRKIVEQ